MARRSGQDDHVSPIEETIDRLYSLGPDEFTNERNEAAKRLRAEGDRAGSDLVKTLKRPTVAAWAVNQLRRRRPDLVDELLEAGVALRGAQRAAVSGSRKVDLRAVTQRRREAVGGLLEETAMVLEEAGRDPASHADAVRSTLEAASADEATGALLRSGRLTKEAEPPSGLGDITPFEVLQGGGGSTAEGLATGAEVPMDQSPAARRVRERLEMRRAKAEEALTVAREAAVEADREAAAATREVDRLERELRTARRRVERASKAATATEARAREAERALARAQSDLDVEP